MSNREAVPKDQKFVAWQRQIEDRLGTLERRKTQGAITLDSLQTNGNTDIAGDLAVGGNLTVGGTTLDAVATLLFSSADVSPIASVSPAVTDVPGTEIFLTVPGRYAVFGNWDFSVTAAANTNVQGWLQFTGTAVPTPGTNSGPAGYRALYHLNTLNARITVSSRRLIDYPGGPGTVKLGVTKGAALGTVACIFGAVSTHITAIRIGAIP